MQINVSNVPVTNQNVSAWELPLRLSTQLVDELNALNAGEGDDYRLLLRKIRAAHDTIASISISVQKIYHSTVSELLYSYECAHEALDSERATLRGGSIRQEHETVS